MINNNIHSDLYIRLFPGRAVGRLVGRWLSRPQVENVNLRKTSTFHFSPSSPPTFTNRVEHMEPSRKSRSGSSIELYRSIDPRSVSSLLRWAFILKFHHNSRENTVELKDQLRGSLYASCYASCYANLHKVMKLIMVPVVSPPQQLMSRTLNFRVRCSCCWDIFHVVCPC